MSSSRRRLIISGSSSRTRHARCHHRYRWSACFEMGEEMTVPVWHNPLTPGENVPPACPAKHLAIDLSGVGHTVAGRNRRDPVGAYDLALCRCLLDAHRFVAAVDSCGRKSNGSAIIYTKTALDHGTSMAVILVSFTVTLWLELDRNTSVVLTPLMGMKNFFLSAGVKEYADEAASTSRFVLASTATSIASFSNLVLLGVSLDCHS
ncbi:hypothetical protein Tco_1047845 [Tanacetum coccineum]